MDRARQANNVTEDFIRYARPLILGELEVPMVGGLPDYVAIDPSRGPGAKIKQKTQKTNTEREAGRKR